MPEAPRRATAPGSLAAASRNLPVATSVAWGHLARGRGHASRIAGRAFPTLTRITHRVGVGTGAADGAGRGSDLASAYAALEDGELTRAHDLAVLAGWRGVRLRQHVAGVLGALAPPLVRSSQATPVVGRGVGPVVAGADPMTVLHLVKNSLPHTVAGYTTRTQGLAEAQRAAGVDAHVVTRIGYPVTRGHLTARAVETVNGVPHHRLLTNVPSRADRALARDVARTARLVEEIRPLVLHAHSPHPNAQVALALRQQFGLPVVYEVRGFLEETARARTVQGSPAGSSEQHRLTRALETHCMEAADAVVTISQSMREAIIERGVDPDKVFVVPNSVGDPLLAAEAASTVPGRPSPGPVTVGAIGTLNDYEGLDTVIEALTLLRDRGGPDVRLLLVGDGPARGTLEAKAREAGIAAEFTGRVSPIEAIYAHRRLDVHVTPRRDLTVTRLVPPIKPVEAMALGRPVIVSDLPPLRELVTHGHDGWLVPAGSAAALADAIAELAGSPELRRRLGAAARSTVARTRTWARASETYSEVYARATTVARATAPSPSPTA